LRPAWPLHGELDGCLDNAVDTLATQPEPAEAAADAALNICASQEIEYIRANGRAVDIGSSNALRDAYWPHVAAHAMLARADRAKHHRCCIRISSGRLRLMCASNSSLGDWDETYDAVTHPPPADRRRRCGSRRPIAA
jgi:hypothetical protein